MDAEQVKALLVEALPDCELNVQGEGSHYDIVAIGECFEGLNRVRRQQTVYAALGPSIQNGSIHAVNIRALTPAEA